jgi:hypothetical protein
MTMTIEDRLVRDGGLELPSLDEIAGLRGYGAWALFNEAGDLCDGGFFRNLITQVGDEYYGERAAGIASPPAQVTGMQLGTGSTAVAKTGAGAAVVTYVSGSNVAIDGGFPTSSIPASARRITWQTTWAAGVATATGLAEVVLINQSIATNAGAAAADTIARALLSPTVNKGASDTLVVSWAHDLLGA